MERFRRFSPPNLTSSIREQESEMAWGDHPMNGAPGRNHSQQQSYLVSRGTGKLKLLPAAAHSGRVARVSMSICGVGGLTT